MMVGLDTISYMDTKTVSRTLLKASEGRSRHSEYGKARMGRENIRQRNRWRWWQQQGLTLSSSKGKTPGPLG